MSDDREKIILSQLYNMWVNIIYTTGFGGFHQTNNLGDLISMHWPKIKEACSLLHEISHKIQWIVITDWKISSEILNLGNEETVHDTRVA